MEDMPNLDCMGVLYMEVLRSADLSVTEEKPGVYRISGTAPSGKTIEGYLDNNDLNRFSKRLQHILGMLAEKPEGETKPLGHQQYCTMDAEGLKKKQEIDRLLRGEADE
jgi:hypothetical protein